MPTQDFIYCRQFTEVDEKHGPSIEDQLSTVTRLAIAQGATIPQIIRESESAKVPGRPVFDDFMRTIHRHEVRIIYCTSLDRLAQNRIDGAALVWALANGMILEIVTPTDSFCHNIISLAILMYEFRITEEDVKASDPGRYASPRPVAG